MVPALADVGAVGALANGVQVELAGQLLQVVEGLAHGRAGFQPLRFRHGFTWGKVDLDQRVGLDERGHGLFYCMPLRRLQWQR